jgi:peptidyl-prolyl cis-trans isomerase C
VISLKIFAIPSLFLIFAGLCFPQSAPKTKPAPAKTVAPAADSAAKPQSKETPKETEDETVPPAAPNALFPAVVAKVNGKSVLGRELEQLVRSQLAQIGSPEWKNLRDEYRGQLVLESLNSLISSRLLYQKATDSGIKATDLEIQAELQSFSKSFKSDAEMNQALASQQMDRASLEKSLRQNLVISKFVEENVTKKIVVTPDEAAKYYSGHPAEFQHPDVVRISLILIQPAGNTSEQDDLAKQRAEALLARIKKGEDFGKIAKENSVDSSASQGGDIGFVSKENLAPELSDAAFSLPIGGVKLIKSSFGYHILKATEKKKEGLSTLEEVKAQLIDFLKDQKTQTELNKLVTQLRDQSKVEILIPAGQPLNP